MTRKVWFQSGIAIILTLIIIMLIMQVGEIFKPIFIIINTVFIPILIGGLLYYITEPIQRFFEKKGAGRITSILAVLIIIAILLSVLGLIIVPMLVQQVHNLIELAPQLQREFKEVLNFVLSQRERLPFDPNQYISRISEQGSQILSNLASNAFSILSGTVSVLLMLVLIPFFFFFMLKDHEKFVPTLLSPFEGTFRQFLSETFHDIDETLRSFIQGQLLVSSILAVVLFIGYSLIGLEYALLLAVLALLTNIIPFIGPWMAFLPAAILAVIQDPFLLIWVSLITLLAQQLESNIITPNVMGQSLSLHPLTVITVVLAAGNIAGFIGMLIAIPTYAVLKAIVQNVWKFRKNLKATMFKDA